jgi:CheY-like chemotaxis protein
VIALTFPLAAPAEDSAHTRCGSPDFGGQRVLLAEDNPINREIAVEMLKSLGLTADTVGDGAAAVERVAAEPGAYAAVLMDIQMPVMDGLTAARQIRALPDPCAAAVPILAMTANAFQEDRDAASAAGMQGYITKPLDPGQMTAELGRVIKNRPV